jgi:hypothetical protein
VAHNAGLGEQNEGDYIPILKEPMTSAGYCVSCHSEDDPTCSGTEAGKASHFMGDPTLAETYLDDEPPLRTDPWPESGLKSHYDGDNEQVVGCLSCHAFRPGALISGDDGLSKYLLARAGNPVEWKEGEMDTYLCTGCHSSNPATKGSGHTHPLMTADVTLMPGEVPKPPITATPSGKINCDSCHRSHNAPSNGGYYILELVTSENTDPQAIQPKIDFTEVCHSCHESTKY